MLKNRSQCAVGEVRDQIIPINGMLKNLLLSNVAISSDQIIPINGMLKNCTNTTTE